MTDPLKRVCDHDKYNVLPCPNAGVKLDEYWDTMIRGRGGWGNLCRDCVISHGYIASQSTTHMVWDGVAGCYIKKRRELMPMRTNIHRPPLVQTAGDWMHCPCGNDVGGAGFHPCNINGAYCEPDIQWDSGWYRCDGCGQRYIEMTHVFKAMLGLPEDFHPTYATKTHMKDEDCTGFIHDGCCSICGAGHGEPCGECNASAYHRDGCTQSD